MSRTYRPLSEAGALEDAFRSGSVPKFANLYSDRSHRHAAVGDFGYLIHRQFPDKHDATAGYTFDPLFLAAWQSLLSECPFSARRRDRKTFRALGSAIRSSISAVPRYLAQHPLLQPSDKHTITLTVYRNPSTILGARTSLCNSNATPRIETFSVDMVFDDVDTSGSAASMNSIAVRHGCEEGSQDPSGSAARGPSTGSQEHRTVTRQSTATVRGSATRKRGSHFPTRPYA